MSELYRHLLIPPDALFLPELESVARFLAELGALGALPKETKFIVVVETGRTRVWGTNAKTGEKYYGPDLKILHFLELQDAIESASGEGNFDLVAEARGPAEIVPFDLYDADNYASRHPRVLSQKPYTLTVRCKLRTKITHFLHSIGCKCDLKPDEPGVFKIPWNDRSIESGALGCARFWIEFGIGDYLMPKITDSLEILDPRLVAAADRTFGIKFGQGCICNDD